MKYHKAIYSRRDFLAQTAALSGAALGGPAMLAGPALGSEKPDSEKPDSNKPGSRMRFGLVTYLWGQDWDVPTLIANGQKSDVLGVELRTTHAHRVEPNLNRQQRAEVKKRFDDSRVTLVGIGGNERFDHPDAAKLAKAVEATKAFVVLSHDVGGTGVKVKPNDFHKDIPREQTIAQIGGALNKLAKFAAGYGQEIRLEVHGQCARLPDIRKIMDVADHPSVGVCWNSNARDLEGEGLTHNFDLVKQRFGATCHVRELSEGSYPYAKLFKMLVAMDYAGWVLLEARGKPKDRVAALREQRQAFDKLVADGQQG